MRREHFVADSCNEDCNDIDLDLAQMALDYLAKQYTTPKQPSYNRARQPPSQPPPATVVAVDSEQSNTRKLASKADQRGGAARLSAVGQRGGGGGGGGGGSRLLLPQDSRRYNHAARLEARTVRLRDETAQVQAETHQLAEVSTVSSRSSISLVTPSPRQQSAAKLRRLQIASAGPCVTRLSHRRVMALWPRNRRHRRSTRPGPRPRQGRPVPASSGC